MVLQAPGSQNSGHCTTIPRSGAKGHITDRLTFPTLRPSLLPGWRAGLGSSQVGPGVVTLLSALTPEDFVEGHLVSRPHFTQTHTCVSFPLSITWRAVF